MAFRTEEREFTCSVCGTSSSHTIIAEQDEFCGAPDLDLRPAGKQRSIMKYWAMECPCCGYCCTTLDMPFSGGKEFFQTTDYKICGGILTADETAVKLMKRALVFIEEHNYRDAVRSYLAAAWALDDDGNEFAAKQCRMAAVALMDDHPAAFKNSSDYQLLKADMLRRCGEFDRVVREFEDKAYPSQLMTAIGFFEVYLASSGDQAAHAIDEIPGVTAVE